MSDSNEKEVFTGAGTDWHNRAMIGFMSGVHWSIYVDGYKEAADRLVAGIDAGQGKVDFLVFPILHLYRHYLELSLKANIRMCQVLLDVQRPTLKEARKDSIRAAQGHDLSGLWDYLQELVPGIYPDVEEIYITGINRVIKAFAALDPAGDQTRYPLDRQENQSLPKLKEVNLRQLADDMARADNGFTQIEGAIDYELEHREYNYEMEREMEAELRSWYEY